MDHDAYQGTVTSKLRPIVTMLTDALVKDFCPAYTKIGDGLWERTDENGQIFLVTDAQLWQDVHDWLLNLEHEMEDVWDREFAKVCVHMIRKNKGWVSLLTARVKKRIG